ncbi:MAG: hypothetical protein KKF12_17160 [Proteobacteria bacterium]|nr:hypothetical protein [Desulfobacula sp.]MBU3951881.1 hypothetical protein [Pseudomonadota bacterium]MBU4132547.1 hypothetical protein [Pseudomonadota bacterium]
MQECSYFNKKALERVDKSVLMAEELVNNFFKLSSGQWLKNRYDIKTAKDLSPHERICGPVAQVVKYEGRKKEIPLVSSSFSLYTVCLQDGAILSLLEKDKTLLLDPLLLYVLTHELVHVVRFLRFEHRYENVGEANLTLAEERRVHGLTHSILHRVSLPGLDQVFNFYGEWREGQVEKKPGKNFG